MGILDSILGADGGQSVQAMAKQFGLSDAQVNSAMQQLVPALKAGVKKNTGSGDGMQSLMAALQGGTHQRYLQNASAVGDPTTVSDGNAILGHLLGSKDVSRAVADKASQETGIGSDVLRQMLPVAASMFMGALDQNKSQFSGGSDGGLGGLTSLLDADGDGSVVDDLMNMAQRFLR